MLDILQHYSSSSSMLTCGIPLHYVVMKPLEQVDFAAHIKSANGILLTEWVAPTKNSSAKNTDWYTLYLLPTIGLCCVQTMLNPKYPALYDLSVYFPVCQRLQRAIYDLTRISTFNAVDHRSWLNHGYFPNGILTHPLYTDTSKLKNYTFIPVSGNGVHEIPVGPVHAGIIEPGHFRFSVVGEHVLKLETRLGYAHKGIHQLLKNKSVYEAAKIIGRISGDSTVAYSLAFARACEQAKSIQISTHIELQRSLFLEWERLMNHIADIGSIINDAGLPSLQSPFQSLKERLLRYNTQYFKHRYLMDCILPFESMRITKDYLISMPYELTFIKKHLASLQDIHNNHFGLQDRLQNTGILTKSCAKDLSVLGLTAKASGLDNDLRRLFPSYCYPINSILMCSTTTGDVADRVSVRFKECFESIHLIAHWIEQLSQEKESVAEPIVAERIHFGIACVEAWRGPITVIVSLNNTTINWCHFHDPSWQNWLAVEHAVLNNIVADFPLINKSFNLSYSGHDS